MTLDEILVEVKRDDLILSIEKIINNGKESVFGPPP